MPWTYAALMPHAPILIPEVGLGREQKAAQTLDGLDQLCTTIHDLQSNKQTSADILLILSPHHPYAPGKLVLNNAPRPSGNLNAFGAPQIHQKCTTPNDDLLDLARHLHTAGTPSVFGEIPDISKDHGTLVPLYFLQQAMPGQKLPSIIMACPIGLNYPAAYILGKALGTFSSAKRWALIASADLSHCLLQGAPGGYNPAGKVFDSAVVAALEEGSAQPLLELDPAIINNAAECGLRSVLILLGLVESAVQVFSYEGPFGVGYCNALWHKK